MNARSACCTNQYWDKGKTEMADHKPWLVIAGTPVLACSSDLSTQSSRKTLGLKPFQPLGCTAGGDGQIELKKVLSTGEDFDKSSKTSRLICCEEIHTPGQWTGMQD